VRTFRLVDSADAGADSVCEQTLTNIGSTNREVCHWGRLFSPGGRRLIPLGDRPTDFEQARNVMKMCHH
jgi:hypothetical protein